MVVDGIMGRCAQRKASGNSAVCAGNVCCVTAEEPAGLCIGEGGPWCRNECVPVEPTTSVATAAVSLDGVTSDPSIDLCRRVVVFAGTARARLALPHPADRCGCSHLTQIIRARVFFPIMAMVDA
jgi:hypothetical protein